MLNWARATPGIAIKRAATATAVQSTFAGSLGRTAAILASEPEVGFEPTTYHLRGGCSARLSYSGGSSGVYQRHFVDRLTTEPDRVQLRAGRVFRGALEPPSRA